MAIAFRSTNGVMSGTSSGSSIAVTKPSGVADGDLLVVAMYTDDCTVSGVPSGWTLAGEVENAGPDPDFWIRVYWKRAASEGASWTWETSASVWFAWECAAYTGGLASGDAIDGTPTTAFNGLNALPIPAVTTTVDGSMLIAIAGNFPGDAYASGTAPVTNERADANGLCLYDGIQATAGSSGTITLTKSGSNDHHAGVLLALKPASEGGSTTPQSAGGATVSPTGSLTTIVSFKQSVGGHSAGPTGALTKLTSKSVGGHSASALGDLVRLTSKTVGGHTASASGSISTMLVFLVAVGGATVSPTATLARSIGKNVGGFTATATGAISRLIGKSVGSATVSPAAALTKQTATTAGGGTVPAPTGEANPSAVILQSAGGGIISAVGTLLAEIVETPVTATWEYLQKAFRKLKNWV